MVYENTAGNGTTYLYGLDLFAKQEGNTTTYYHYDAHGNVVATSDTNGDIYDREVSLTDAYGVPVIWAEGNDFLYSGEYLDGETGYYYLRARYYDPELGRFITEDPIESGINWYTYCNNDPIAFVDPTGLIPTLEAAAAMAAHIYDWEEDSDESGRVVAGWRLIDVWRGRESLKMGFYIKDGDDWRNPSEYAIVFRGSIMQLNMETVAVWKNNAEQFLSAKSADMWDAINYSSGFAGTHAQEITFIGHSKGGAEALAAAVATNKNAMVFNPAKPNLVGYNLSASNYTATATSYIVKGEALNVLFGEPGVGQVKYLPQQHRTPWLARGYVEDAYDVINLVRNHSREAFLNGVEMMVRWGVK